MHSMQEHRHASACTFYPGAGSGPWRRVCTNTSPPLNAAAQDPVATPHGIIFSREAILENLLAQKKAIRRKLALWEAQQAGTTRKVLP